MKERKKILTSSSTNESLNTAQVIEEGHIVHLPLDGTAVDLDISCKHDLEPFARCERCERPYFRSFVSDFIISQRCTNTLCRIERENNQVRIEQAEEWAKQQEKTREPSFMKKFGIAPGHYHCTLENLENCGNCREAERVAREFLTGDYRTLLITGNTGIGKTHLAVAILRKYAEQEETSLRFESAVMMLSKFKDSYSGKGEKTELDLIREYASIKFLVIDDLGVEIKTENSISIITTIIAERVSRPDRRAVITSNFGTKKLEQIYGSRLVSRLTGTTGLVIHIVAPDYRKGDHGTI